MKAASVGSRKGLVVYRATGGIFDDFASPHALPKHELVSQLQAAGYDDLAKLAIAGRYDDDPPRRGAP